MCLTTWARRLRGTPRFWLFSTGRLLLALPNLKTILRPCVTHFGFGQSPFPIHRSIVEELKNNATNNHYLPVNGLVELRQQVSAFLKNNQGIHRESDLIFIGITLIKFFRIL